MRNNTFEDYKKAIQAKYEIEKEGVYFNFLSPPSQANLRKLCWEIFKSNTSNEDLKTFHSFFEFEFDLTKKNHFREQTDRFRPIGSFLKGEKVPSNRFAVELAAVLVDFHPRPYKKYKDEGIIILDKPANNPNLPETILVKPEDEVKTYDGLKFIDSSIKEKPKSFLEVFLADFLRSFRGKFSERFTKKLKSIIIAVTVIFCLIAAVIYFYFFNKGCMQWSDDHYEIVYCDKAIEGNLNDVVELDDNLLNFKKVNVCDTTNCFKPDGEAIVWYAKTSKGVDFFNANGNGRHPETKKALRPVTAYIQGKYKRPCRLK